MPLSEKAAKLKEATANKAEQPRHKEAVVDATKTLATGTPTQPARTPFGTTGTVGKDSQGYSIARAYALATGTIGAEYAKEEIETSNRLKSLYGSFAGFSHNYRNSILIPFSTDAIPVLDESHTAIDSNKQKFVNELREKMAAFDVKSIDEDEIDHYRAKTLTVGVQADGGALRGFPTMGELVEMQRVNEIFSKAGATQLTLNNNGLMYIPKQQTSTTAYMVNETGSLTTSQPGLGQARLSAKKMTIETRVSAEALKFINPSLEALTRRDIAAVGARKVDQQIVYGTGSETEVLGLDNYETATSWSEGVDKILLFAPSGGSNGWKFQPENIEDMEALLPDGVDDDNLLFIMRRQLFAKIRNRRSAAVSSADNEGPFMFDRTRSSEDGSKKKYLGGHEVLRSDTILANRTKSSGSGLTNVWLGKWSDLVIARFGVMEVDVNPFLYWNTDVTSVRGRQFFDAVLRRNSSVAVFKDVEVA